jgi:uncharacterized protein YoxC
MMGVLKDVSTLSDYIGGPAVPGFQRRVDKIVSNLRDIMDMHMQDHQTIKRLTDTVDRWEKAYETMHSSFINIITAQTELWLQKIEQLQRLVKNLREDAVLREASGVKIIAEIEQLQDDVKAQYGVNHRLHSEIEQLQAEQERLLDIMEDEVSAEVWEKAINPPPK